MPTAFSIQRRNEKDSLEGTETVEEVVSCMYYQDHRDDRYRNSNTNCDLCPFGPAIAPARLDL
jgi:hypothetical protein